jgi:hypothetical protein
MSAFPAVTSIPYDNPISEDIRFKTLISQFDDLGEEKRKQKWLFPKRNITLQYTHLTKIEAVTLWAFYLARNGPFNAFSFFYPWTNSYTTEYVGTGDGSTTVWNLCSAQATVRTLYLDGASQTEGGVDWTFSSEGGADGADLCTFVAAPTDGQRITFTFQGYLKVYCRFADDIASFDSFFDAIVNTGLKLRGELNA